MSRLLVGSYTPGEPEIPVGLRVINSNGQHEIIEGVGYNPTYFTFACQNQHLYVCDEVEKSSIYLLKQSGSSWVKVAQYSTKGAGACHILVNKSERLVFVSNYHSGSLIVFDRNTETGELNEKQFFQFTEFSNKNPERQESPHCHSTILDPSEMFCYAADLGNDCIYQFLLDANNGLSFNPAQIKVNTHAASGPRHLTCHSSGRYLYATFELSGEVGVFSVSENGILNQIDQVRSRRSNAEGCCENAHLQLLPPNENILYVSNRFHDSIASFKVLENGARLEYIGELENDGKIPRNFSLSRDFRKMVVGYQGSDEVKVYDVDEFGALSIKLRFECPKPAKVDFIDN